MGISEKKIDFTETGSMHMSNEFSNNERFIPIDSSTRKMIDKHANDIQLRSSQKSIQLGKESALNFYSNEPIYNEIEGQSHKQVEGFMKNNRILPPPESVASSLSLPMTSFEDTQQMMKAYKRKKREIAKIKD